MLSKSKFGAFALVAVLFLLLSVSLAAAQYTTEQTTNVTIGSNGTFTATLPDVGVSYQITGVAGTTGTVTADGYSGNPQPTASVPTGVSLTDFVAVTFNIPSSDFSQAIVTLNYTASEVQNIKSPYAVYKYVSSSNSYVALPSTVDAGAKTITVTLSSISDPVLAVGGAKISSGSGLSTAEWIVIVVSIIVILLVVVFVVGRVRFRRPDIAILDRNEQNADFSAQSLPPQSKVENPPQPQPANLDVENQPPPPVSTSVEDVGPKQLAVGENLISYAELLPEAATQPILAETVSETKTSVPGDVKVELSNVAVEKKPRRARRRKRKKRKSKEQKQ